MSNELQENSQGTQKVFKRIISVEKCQLGAKGTERGQSETPLYSQTPLGGNRLIRQLTWLIRTVSHGKGRVVWCNQEPGRQTQKPWNITPEEEQD